MARSRNIKPGFFTNDDLGELDPLARLLFAGMWTIADREGRLEDRPKKIKAEVLPYDNCDAELFLSQLAERNFILRYEVDGKKYIQVLAWEKHQNPHCKEAASVIPAPAHEQHHASTVQAPDKNRTSTEVAGLIPDSLNLIPNTQESPAPAALPTPAGAVCVLLRSKGIATVNPSHPELRALLDAGTEIGAFDAAADIAAKAGHPSMAYVLGIVKRQAEEAKRIASEGLAAPAPAPRSASPPVTVPSRPGIDPALAKLRAEEGRLRGPTPEQLAQLRAVRTAVKVTT